MSALIKASLWNRFTKTLARWRTYVVNLLLAGAVLAPEVLHAPEILAVIPRDYQRWALAAVFLLNIWMRPRPAVLPGDDEVKARKETARAQ